MANALMMRYAATRGDDRDKMRGDDDRGMRMGTYDERGMGDHPDGGYDRPENRRRRQPNQYTRRSMNEDWPEDNERTNMRRRRDYRGRFAGGDDDDDDDEREDRMSYARQDPSRRRTDNRFIPPYGDPPMDGMYDGGGIGFGMNERRMPRSHYGEQGQHGRHMVRAGGTFYMEPDADLKSGHEKTLTREAAQKWVDSMEYYDEASKKHMGGKWSMTEVKPFAGKLGVPIDGEEFYEFFAMMNAMYADYMAVARKFGVTSPEFYAMMAKAWMDDPDAVDGKTMMYYDCIVKKPE